MGGTLIFFLGSFLIIDIFIYIVLISKFPKLIKRLLRATLILSYLSFGLYLALRVFSPFELHSSFIEIILYISAVKFALFNLTLIYFSLYKISKRVNLNRKRRNFLQKSLAYFTIFATPIYSNSEIDADPMKVKVDRVEIKIDNFSKLKFKILQISDFHIGNYIGQRETQKIVDLANSLNPDLIVLTGDIFSKKLNYIKESILELERLEATYGVYYIFGNTEYRKNPKEILEYFQKESRIKILNNSSVKIDSIFNLVGVNDYIGYIYKKLEPDLDKAFKDIDRTLPTILLSHQPRMAKKALKYKPDLILSGHTHGGQILPFGKVVIFNQEYFAGLYKCNRVTQIFVSRGVGYTGPAIRLSSDSEINLIEIV